jgi:hypothetical protein
MPSKHPLHLPRPLIHSYHLVRKVQHVCISRQFMSNVLMFKVEYFMLCVTFWVVLRHMVFNIRRFGKLCPIFIGTWITTQKVTHDIQNTAKA